MSVTVFALRRAPAGQGTAFLAMGLQGLEEQARAPGQILPQERCLYQGLEDPELLVRVTDWESRAAYQACRAHSRISHALDALSVAPPARYFFQPLRFYGRLRYRPEATLCLLLEAPPNGAANLLRFLEEVAHPAALALPGLVRRQLYQDLDEPRRFLVRLGWASRGDRAQARGRLSPAIQRLQARLSTLELRFIGRRRPGPTPHSRADPPSLPP
jgi:heme-degrading monooxygenase HmoA